MPVQAGTGSPSTRTVYVLFVLPLNDGASHCTVAPPRFQDTAWMLVGAPGAGSRVRVTAWDSELSDASPIDVTVARTVMSSAVNAQDSVAMLVQVSTATPSIFTV